MKKRLSLQWRLTLTAAALVTAACVLLTLLIGGTAFAQLDNIESTVIEIETGDGSPLMLDVEMEELLPDLADQLRVSRADVLRHSLFAMGAVILSASVCTYFLAGRALEPLRRLSRRMEEVQAQNLSQPLEIPATGDELARLSKAFNGMLGRLSESFEAQRQFSASAAHELRTPLAVIQANLEVLKRYPNPTLAQYSQAVEMVWEQTGRLGNLVEVLLAMTQLGTVQRGDRVSLSAMVEEVICDLLSVAQGRQVTLIQQQGEAQITGSDPLLYRAIYNLVENAIKYNRPGGTVTVACRREGEQATVTVADTGAGIAQENWEKIFEPFFRLDKSRSREMGGAGLGLALVRKIARQHGGSVRVESSSPEGTRIVLSLPVA